MRLTILRLVCILCTCHLLIVTHAQDTPLTPINAADILQMIEAGMPVELTNRQVNGILDFGSLVRQQELPIFVLINIESSVFKDDVIIGDTVSNIRVHFQQPLSFVRSTFEKQLILSQADFDFGVNFNEVTFAETGTVIFGSSVFDEQVDFSGVHINNAITFTDINFGGGALFTAAHFNFSENIFSDVSFGNNTRFDAATITGNIRFVSSNFGDAISFQRATFDSPISFSNSTVNTFDLRYIRGSHDSINLSGLTYTRLLADNEFNIRWLEDGINPIDAVNMYTQIEQNFRTTGNQALANDALFLKREWECKDAKEWSSSSINCALSTFVGHLVRPVRIIVEILFVILFFTCIYIIFGIKRKVKSAVQYRVDLTQENNLIVGTVATGISEANTEHAENEDNFRTKVSKVVDYIWQSFLPAISLSFDIFVSVKLSGIEIDIPSKNVLTLLFVRLCILIEWLLGIILLVALAATLANTLPLVSTAFDIVR
jgi:hypothetical protein